MDQISGTTPSEAPAQDQHDSQPADGSTAEQPGFGSRGRARRRVRFLRKARELAYRDLGGLVFNLHQFGQRNDALVLAKLATLGHIDRELRTIETALQERQPITVLREAGITACPRCAAIHGSEDRFCPNCGLPIARNVDLPIAGAPAGAPTSSPAPPQAPQAAAVPAPAPPISPPVSTPPVSAPPVSAPPLSASPPAPPAVQPPSIPPTPDPSAEASPIPGPLTAGTPPSATPAIQTQADTATEAPATPAPGAPTVERASSANPSARSPSPLEARQETGVESLKSTQASGTHEESTEIIHPRAPGA